MKSTILVIVGFLAGYAAATIVDRLWLEIAPMDLVELRVTNATDRELQVFLHQDLMTEGPWIAAGETETVMLEDIGEYRVSAAFNRGLVIVDGIFVVDESREMELEVRKLQIVETGKEGS